MGPWPDIVLGSSCVGTWGPAVAAGRHRLRARVGGGTRGGIRASAARKLDGMIRGVPVCRQRAGLLLAACSSFRRIIREIVGMYIGRESWRFNFRAGSQMELRRPPRGRLGKFVARQRKCRQIAKFNQIRSARPISVQQAAT